LEVSPYEAGKPIEETKREFGLKEVVKLASNENPLGPSLRAREAIKKAIPELNRYPDSGGFYLKKKLARFYNLKPQNFVLGNGSDELIDVAIKTFVEEDENIVTSECTFLEYKIIAAVNGRRLVSAPLKYFKYDLEGIKRRIDKKTKLIFIANPNNHTGTYVNKFELEDFLRVLPREIIVVLDEAYDLFVDVNDFPNSLAYLNRRNVIVLKTFSKAYALAGIRVGCAIAADEFTPYMERVRQPFNVNSLAQAAAAAALEDKKFLKKSRAIISKGKEYIYDELSAMGLAYQPSAANFILVDVGRDGRAFFKEMLKFGVIVRDMRQYGLKNFIRVTIGTSRENERFIKVLKKILK